MSTKRQRGQRFVSAAFQDLKKEGETFVAIPLMGMRHGFTTHSLRRTVFAVETPWSMSTKSNKVGRQPGITLIHVVPEGRAVTGKYYTVKFTDKHQRKVTKA